MKHGETRHGETRRRRPAHPAPSRLCAPVAAAFGAILLVAAAASAQEPSSQQPSSQEPSGQQPGGQEAALVEETEEVTATVTAIEPETRMLTLRDEDGEEFTVQAGNKVRNFERIEIGDQVDVLFYEALMAEVTDAPPTTAETTGGEPVVVDTRRAPIGDKPGGAASVVTTAVVTIDAVDLEENTVQFTGPGGQPREVEVKRPEMQEFIKTLSAGDRVQVTYGEALAVAVRPGESEEAE